MTTSPASNWPPVNEALRTMDHPAVVDAKFWVEGCRFGGRLRDHDRKRGRRQHVSIASLHCGDPIEVQRVAISDCDGELPYLRPADLVGIGWRVGPPYEAMVRHVLCVEL